MKINTPNLSRDRKKMPSYFYLSHGCKKFSVTGKRINGVLCEVCTRCNKVLKQYLGEDE